MLSILNRIRSIIGVKLERVDESKLDIKRLTLVPNPRYAKGKLWGYRPRKFIDKIIVHQAMCECSTIDVHNYHISEKSHLKPGGAPKIAYHFTIEKDGTVYLVNEYEDVVWHCRGQNMMSIGILVLGDFSGKGYIGKSEPTSDQLNSLSLLLEKLTTELSIEKTNIYCHSDFGKPACPGKKLSIFIGKYKGMEKQ